MIEADVERRLKHKLEVNGFLVLKLVTPGYNGTPDRLILRPRYSPGAPWVIELKRPGEVPRALQVQVARDWTRRGVQVLPPVSAYNEVDALVLQLLDIVNKENGNER